MISREEILDKVHQYEEEAISLRRYFHQIPELGMKEYKTSQAICRYLTAYGIRPIPLDPTGVTAYIGPEEGRVIALRADIDALQIPEETGAEYASCHPGYMHACGHDGHIAGLLLAARILKELEGKLTVRVKLIFQPSEENTLGAKHVISRGILEDVHAIFGLHLFSDLPCGLINVEPGPRMAQTDRFSITFEGRGGHAGKPHLCVDATLMAAEYIMSAQSIVSRQINPIESAVVTIGSLHSGTQYNIISQKAELAGTCRSFSEETARQLRSGLERRAYAIADCYGGRAVIDYDYGSHPPVINHEEYSRQIRTCMEGLLPQADYSHTDPLMLGEDFSWYQQSVPGVFAFVGCGKADGSSYPNHHPGFEIEEKALSYAGILHLAAVMAMEQNQ